jgi:hypothetical protein
MNTFALSQGAGQKLEFAFQRNDGTTSDLDWLSTGENLKSVILLARGEAELTVKVKPAPEPEVVIDPIIRVDRSVRPSYPDWVKTVMHPELEPTGPAEYDIAKVEQWLHDGQKSSKWMKGEKLYTYLEETDTLKTCLGLRDLEEIQKKGIAFFRKYFKGKAIFGWASVVRNHRGSLDVPYLFESGGGVVLRWRWLGDDWNSNRPALRHAS